MKLILLSLTVLILAIGCSRQQHPDFTRSIKETNENAWYVRAYRDHQYILEHQGHRYTVKCRESRAWLHGDDEPYGLQSDNDCVYLPGMVGKYIGNDLMVTLGNELHLCPWLGEKTIQTADILDVTSEELMDDKR